MYGLARKVNITLPTHGRTIVISDIHGNLPFLQGLLKKLDFSQKDLLIILGDMLEKGQYNLETLRYIMELEKTHQLHCVCGNCDAYIAMFFQSDQYDAGFFQEYLKRPMTEHSILRQMAKESGLESKLESVEEMDGLEYLAILRKTIRETHKDIWQWLEALPTILECEEYFFVHAGVASMETATEEDAWDCMKNDYFYEQNYSFSKYMVVGHCPTTLYGTEYQNSNPMIDHERKIISIDGACVLKLDGQLNALLLEGEHISWDYYDGLPQVRALQSQNASDHPLNIRWGHSALEILEDRGEFTLCKHLESGRILEILTCFLQKTGDTVHCEDATDYLLPLEEGEVFSLSHPVQGGCLGKKDGVTGWYWGEYTKL